MSGSHRVRCFTIACCWLLLAHLMPFADNTARAAELKPQTLKAWETYQQLTEARIEQELANERRFMVQDFLPDAQAADCRAALRSGQVCVQEMNTVNADGKTVDVPKGLIHHWMGAVLVPGAQVNDLVAWLQDYDQHEKYFDEVLESRLLSREGDVFDIYMRLKRKKVITVHYDAEMRVEYRHHGPDRISSRSLSTKLAELENVGTDEEREIPEGDDGGYLWRLNSYWRFKQDKDGVQVSCETFSLSRGLPLGIGTLISPIINSLPRESLEGMLSAIRDQYVPKTTAESAQAP